MESGSRRVISEGLNYIALICLRNSNDQRIKLLDNADRRDLDFDNSS